MKHSVAEEQESCVFFSLFFHAFAHTPPSFTDAPQTARTNVCVCGCACVLGGGVVMVFFVKTGKRAFYKWLPGYVPVCRQMSRSELRHSAQTHSSVSFRGTHTRTHMRVCWLFLTDVKLLWDYGQRKDYFVKTEGEGGAEWVRGWWKNQILRNRHARGKCGTLSCAGTAQRFT